MRKYQQLILVVTSLLCVIILLAYKSENNRLKYVLEVVNIFGRNDAASLIRIDNTTRFRTSIYDLGNPMPAWQRLGNDFYSYSTFWQKNEISAGGMVVAIVVGLEHSIVNFKCQVQYSDNSLMTGKLLFSRVEQQAPPTSKNFESFVIYKFLCKMSRDFGTPTNVVFTDIKTSIKHYIPLRILDNKLIKQRLMMTVCVDMNNYDHIDDDFSKNAAILQYFLHHQLIGIDEFIVYNGNGLDGHMLNILNNHGIKLNVLPYNFPFGIDNKQQNRAIIEMDCLLRNLNAASYTVITSINEYVYPSSKIKVNNPFVRFVKKVPLDTNRFTITTRSVCYDSRKKIFSDNSMYDIDVKNEASFYIYRPVEYNKTDSLKSIEVDRNTIFVHKYIDKCLNKNDLYDWTTILNEEFLQYITGIAKELNKLIFR